MEHVEGIKHKTLKIWNWDESIGKVISFNSFEDLLSKVKAKFEMEGTESCRLVMSDMCEVDDDDGLRSIPLLNNLYVLKAGERLEIPQQSSSTGSGPTLGMVLKEIGRKKVEDARLKKKSIMIVKIVFGWMNFNSKERRFQAVRCSKGGGTKSAELMKSYTYDELLTYIKESFFPNGKSPLGKSTKFDLSIGDCNGNRIQRSAFDITTVGKRVNLLSKQKSITVTVTTDSSSSDDELDLPPPWKRKALDVSTLPYDMTDAFQVENTLDTTNLQGSSSNLDMVTPSQFANAGGSLTQTTPVYQSLGTHTDGVTTFQFANATTTQTSPMYHNLGTPTIQLKVSTGNGECPVCCDRRKDTVIFPCGHALCYPCGLHLQLNHKVCPMCRGSISKLCSVNDN